MIRIIGVAFALAVATSAQAALSSPAQQMPLEKDNAVEKSAKSLREAIDKWKIENGVTGPVSETAEKPAPNPYWRRSIRPHLLLPPDVVSDSAYTICWTGVVLPVVCTSGAQVCF